MNEETRYVMALSRLTGYNHETALRLFQVFGSATEVFRQRQTLVERDELCTARQAAMLQDWTDALAHTDAELDYVASHGIQVVVYGSEEYPSRLSACEDAPLVFYYKGTANLNALHIINLVGTRRSTTYGSDLVRRLLTDLRQLMPDVIVVSGLAYGIDVCAHQFALQHGLNTIGVMAHGLDTIYPSVHRDVAERMLHQGGLLTEYMTGTRPDKVNFVQRNRIVAGLCDATIVVESAAHGGSLITANMAYDYQRTVCAFPGPVGSPASEGCNELIRTGMATLITSASDLMETLGWHADSERPKAIEREMFPTLTDEEQSVVATLQAQGDLQINQLSVASKMPIGTLTAILFSLEMKGVVRPLAGGIYHLLD